MKNLYLLIFCFFLLFNTDIKANETKMILELEHGKVEIELYSDVAPNHVKRIQTLKKNKEYDGVVFHRVIDGFMAQTGDVEFGNSTNDKFNMSRAGTGGSNLPDIPAEFSDANHGRGAVSMARAQNPNSANSQFFIVFNDASFLDGQYTVWAQVTEGMELVDNITRGEPPQDPDKIIKMEIISE